MQPPKTRFKCRCIGSWSSLLGAIRATSSGRVMGPPAASFKIRNTEWKIARHNRKVRFSSVSLSIASGTAYRRRIEDQRLESFPSPLRTAKNNVVDASLQACEITGQNCRGRGGVSAPDATQAAPLPYGRPSFANPHKPSDYPGTLGS